MSTWHSFRDGGSFHLGFYPDTASSKWQLSFQWIYEYAINLDFGAKWLGDFRFSILLKDAKGGQFASFYRSRKGALRVGPLHFLFRRWPND